VQVIFQVVLGDKQYFGAVRGRWRSRVGPHPRP
jgi:hypothetical protein